MHILGDVLQRRLSGHESYCHNQHLSTPDSHVSAPQSDCRLDDICNHTNDCQDSRSHLSLIRITRKHVYEHDL